MDVPTVHHQEATNSGLEQLHGLVLVCLDGVCLLRVTFIWQAQTAQQASIALRISLLNALLPQSVLLSL